MNKLENFIRSEKNLAGFNVTIPHKINILKYLDYLHPSAKKIGAVNTVKIKRSKNVVQLFGYNTDWLGFEKSLILFLGKFIPVKNSPSAKTSSLSSIKALILGTGGAAKAVAFALAQLGIPFALVSRKPASKKIYKYHDLNKNIIQDHRLIINATPMGMFPEVNSSPLFPFRFITRNHFVFDLIYNPEETLFLKNASSQGAQAKNGFEMLIFQAEKAWEIWKGV